MTDTRAAEAFNERWSFHMTCLLCRASFELARPNTGIHALPGFSRFVLFRIPEVCPECKSLFAVAPATAEPTGEGQCA
jgi:hypothetical protein